MGFPFTVLLLLGQYSTGEAHSSLACWYAAFSFVEIAAKRAHACLGQYSTSEGSSSLASLGVCYLLCLVCTCSKKWGSTPRVRAALPMNMLNPLWSSWGSACALTSLLCMPAHLLLLVALCTCLLCVHERVRAY